MSTKSVTGLIGSFQNIRTRTPNQLVARTATASQWLRKPGAWRPIPPTASTKCHSILGSNICRFYSTERTQGQGSKPPLPLQGITVVSLEQAIAAPFCTRQLADLGARVIKVERPGTGDFARHYDTRVNGLCSHFVWCNRSKESLALDLKDAKDIKTLHKLLGRADVFVQNLAPGATDRLGVSYDALKDAHPALIVCDISGYGSYGPYRDKKAYDLLIQSEAGLLSVTGTKEQPAKAGISIADISAGMYAFSNVLAALYDRQRTGKGCRVDVSMLECMVEWMSFPLYYASDGAPAPVPVGASHAAIYPYGPFQTGDGNSVMIGLQNEREWAKFCSDILEDTSLTEDPRFASNAERSVNRDALTEIIHKALATFTVDQAAEKLDKAGIANASVNDMHRVWAHPQLKSRRRWTTVDSPNGHLPAMLPPGVDPEQANVRMDPIPTVGEHNEKILAELSIE